MKEIDERAWEERFRNSLASRKDRLVVKVAVCVIFIVQVVALLWVVDAVSCLWCRCGNPIHLSLHFHGTDSDGRE